MESPLSRGKLIFGLTVALCILAFFVIRSVTHSDTVVVFCNVGQGDGAYIRVKNKIDIVVDAGPDRKMLSCLGRYMPFYDRTIEAAFMTHPQLDHYGGYLYILDRYQVDRFVTTAVGSESQKYQEMKRKLEQKKTLIRYAFAGEVITVAATKMRFLWPDKSYVQANSYANITGGSNDLMSNMDPNNFSAVFVLSQGDFDILFTGDVNTAILEALPQQTIPDVEILKVPHHGSKNGLTQQFLKLADPEVSVISNGRNNSYGHPAKEILDLLQASGTQIRRTDTDGNIVYRIKSKR